MGRNDPGDVEKRDRFFRFLCEKIDALRSDLQKTPRDPEHASAGKFQGSSERAAASA